MILLRQFPKIFAEVLLTAIAVAAGARQAVFTPDCSTPENAARSFVELLNRGDPKQAAACVLGGSAPLWHEGRLKVGAYIVLAGVSVELSGNEARLSGSLVMYGERVRPLMQALADLETDLGAMLKRYLPDSTPVRLQKKRIQEIQAVLRDSIRTAPRSNMPRGSVLLRKVDGAWRIVPTSGNKPRFLGELANYVMSFQGVIA